jgi:hypothetical protein
MRVTNRKPKMRLGRLGNACAPVRQRLRQHGHQWTNRKIVGRDDGTLDRLRL